MRYRPLGCSGIEASVIGVGTGAVPRWLKDGISEKELIETLRSAIDLGINLIDTAPTYGFGISEEFVGKVISGRRDKVILATKCGLVWHTAKGEFCFSDQGKQVYRYLGAESIRYQVEQSLTRLGTDYIDLYQTHWQDSTTPIEETMSALLELKSQGKIRAIGVSNVTVEQLEEYRKFGSVDSDQENFSMLSRAIEKDLLPYCRSHGIAVLAYSPLCSGLLSGKFGPEHRFDAEDWRGEDRRFGVENRRKVASILNDIAPIARSREVTFAQLVYAWTVAQPGVTHALCGVRNRRQVIENIRAADLILSEGELKAINEAIQRHWGLNTI